MWARLSAASARPTAPPCPPLAQAAPLPPVCVAKANASPVPERTRAVITAEEAHARRRAPGAARGRSVGGGRVGLHAAAVRGRAALATAAVGVEVAFAAAGAAVAHDGPRAVALQLGGGVGRAGVAVAVCAAQ